MKNSPKDQRDYWASIPSKYEGIGPVPETDSTMAEFTAVCTGFILGVIATGLLALMAWWVLG